MSELLVANIVSLAGCVLMACIGLVRSKQKILILQSIQCTLLCIANFLLGGITGAICDMIQMIRNYVCYNKPFTKKTGLTFILFQIGGAVLTGASSLPEWIPCIASSLFTLVLCTPSVKLLKLAEIVCQIMWLYFDLTLQNYTGALFDALTSFTNLVGLIRIAFCQSDEEQEISECTS